MENNLVVAGIGWEGRGCSYKSETWWLLVMIKMFCILIISYPGLRYCTISLQDVIIGKNWIKCPQNLSISLLTLHVNLQFSPDFFLFWECSFTIFKMVGLLVTISCDKVFFYHKLFLFLLHSWRPRIRGTN